MKKANNNMENLEFRCINCNRKLTEDNSAMNCAGCGESLCKACAVKEWRTGECFCPDGKYSDRVNADCLIDYLEEHKV